MKKFVINEKKYIEEIMAADTLPEDVSVGVMINYLVLYHYNYIKDEEFTLENVTNYVVNHMKKYNLDIRMYQDYKASLYVGRIFNQINKEKRSTYIREKDTIDIYQSEIDIINQCDKDKEKKLLFTIYVLAKYENKYGWCYTPISDICKLANISGTSIEKQILIGEMKNKGLLKTPKKIDKLLVGVDLQEKYSEDDKVVISIKDIKNIGNQYVAYSRPDYKQCKVCGRLIKIKGTNMQYCEKCARDKNLEKHKRYNEKR